MQNEKRKNEKLKIIKTRAVYMCELVRELLRLLNSLKKISGGWGYNAKVLNFKFYKFRLLIFFYFSNDTLRFITPP